MPSSSIHAVNDRVSFFLMADFKKHKLIETESIVVVARCWELRETADVN